MASSSTSPSHQGNSSNVDQSQNLLPQSEQPPHVDAGGWDIFLSHSGAQKGFVNGLFKMLSPTYNVFFDRSRASLPLGDDFPTHIFQAAKTCKLAVVVLSNEFFSSKWPMLELSAFMDAMSSSPVKVLPLFYGLSPGDLKNETKREKWHKRWEDIASNDNRIEVSSWSHAFRKVASINGLVFRELDGELAFLEEVMLAIYKLVPLLLKSSHDGIRGRERLCKVFIDKFEELEQRPQYKLSANLSKVYLLGVYGLLGSGKTTLCACLRDHFFPAFSGRALHLNLPTNPTPADLLEHAKQLFKLTDFGHNREELLSSILDLPQVFSLLKVSNLQNSSVFLVIDNITSQDSIDLAEAILHLGVGAGSRVMLVARTLDILHPLLNIPEYYDGHIHYMCDRMRVPSINTMEAIDILMQPGGGLGITSDYTNRMEKKYGARHREIITQVACMCAFSNRSPSYRWQYDLLYLPLALKIIGGQLRSNRTDPEKWERQLSQLKTMVKKFKEDAVRKIVEYSYENLHQNLKLVFLDVALFMVPYHGSHIGYEEAVELLSFMHECDPETLKEQVKELTRLCFLELGVSFNNQTIIAQDFFLEFANSLVDASSMYHCRRRIKADAQEVTQDLCQMVRRSNANLRAVILEVDEKSERYDFPEGLSSVKAVVVRNCKSLTSLGLAGLTSLVSLFVQDCPKLRHVQFDPSHTYTLKSVKWACTDKQPERRSLQSLPHEKVKQLIKKGWCSLWDLGGDWPQRPLNGLMSSASRLKSLQALRLEGTGITSLGNLSSYWPQLRVLEILEDCLEDLEVGYLPHLKRFFFGDEQDFDNFTKGYCLTPSSSKSREKPRMAKKPNLLAGCPELEDMRICVPSCEDGMGTLVIPSPNLRTLWLKGIFCGEPVLPDFTSSAHSLEEIRVQDHRVLQRLEFTHHFLRVAQISLMFCYSLVKITGLECLPSLRVLLIGGCPELQAVENIEGVRMLEELDLHDCPALILTSQGLSSLEFLATVSVYGCPNVQFVTSDLENLVALKCLWCDVFGSTLKLKNLGMLEELGLAWETCGGQADKQASLCDSSGDVKCEHANENAQLMSMQYVTLFEVGESAPAYLSRLELCGVRNLVCLHGVHRLLSLQSLELRSLPQLTCLQGLECLTNLQDFDMSECTAVERLPSLCTLVNLKCLKLVDCVNLKSLEGCDKMGLLDEASFDGCENLEHCSYIVAAQLPQPGSRSLSFLECKFASIKTMLGWVLDEKVSHVVWRASVDALSWEFIHHLFEKPRERMELAEQLVETLGVYFMRKLPALADDHFFDFQSWSCDLKASVRDCERTRKSKASVPRGMERLMEKLGEVPLKSVLQQCQSDAQFRASVAHCLLEIDYMVMFNWIPRLRWRWTFDKFKKNLTDPTQYTL